MQTPDHGYQTHDPSNPIINPVDAFVPLQYTLPWRLPVAIRHAIAPPAKIVVASPPAQVTRPRYCHLWTGPTPELDNASFLSASNP